MVVENEFINSRKSIWECMSMVYLDTELSENEIDHIVSTLSNSSLTVEEIKQIELFEVFPTLKYNMMATAGEWQGFDEEWLHEQCLKNYYKRKSKMWRTFVTFQSNAFFKDRLILWNRIIEKVKSIRQLKN